MIRKWFRRYLTCRILGHSLVVDYWYERGKYHWNWNTWKCQYCGKKEYIRKA